MRCAFLEVGLMYHLVLIAQFFAFRDEFYVMNGND